jgi:hypothetical protein
MKKIWYIGNSFKSTAPDFIMLVKTDNAGTSGSNQFTIPTSGGGYNYDVVTSEQTLTNQTGNITLTWAVAGTYEVKISGVFPRIFFNNSGDRLKVLEIINFGNVGWQDFITAFFGCNNLKINPNATGDFSLVDRSDRTFRRAFRECNIDYFPPLDLSQTTDFRECWDKNPLKIFDNVNMENARLINACWRDCGVIDDFKARNFYQISGTGTNLNLFQNTTLPTNDYSEILISQRANNPITGITFNGGNSKYNAGAVTARNELVNIQGWNIIDGGLEI